MSELVEILQTVNDSHYVPLYLPIIFILPLIESWATREKINCYFLEEFAQKLTRLWRQNYRTKIVNLKTRQLPRTAVSEIGLQTLKSPLISSRIPFCQLRSSWRAIAHRADSKDLQSAEKMNYLYALMRKWNLGSRPAGRNSDEDKHSPPRRDEKTRSVSDRLMRVTKENSATRTVSILSRGQICWKSALVQ